MSQDSKVKISRYIYVPFIFGFSFALISFLLLGDNLNQIIWNFVGFVLLGFATLLFNDYKIGKIASKDNEQAFDRRQTRTVVLFADYERAFDTCLDSINVLRSARISHQDSLQGVIKAKTAMNLLTFGSKISFKLTKITEFSTEIQLTSEPLLLIDIADCGESLKAAEDLTRFFAEMNDEVNKKSLEAKAQLPARFLAGQKNTKVEIK